MTYLEANNLPTEPAGKSFRALLQRPEILRIPGAYNGLAGLLAKAAGFESLYLSGAGVANHSLGLPDLGVTNLGDVVTDTLRITAATDVPLLVDIDTGWGHAFTIDDIPFPETRAYVERVLHAQGDYRRTYPTQLGYG